MNRRQFGKLSLLAFASSTIAKAQVNIQHGIMQPVLTRGYDNARHGVNTRETILTQTAVASRGIKKLFSLPMEGDARGAEAQTLIVPSVKCDDGTTRDVAVIAAMTNDVGVFDANDSDYIWMKKLAVPINVTKAIDSWGINDHAGIYSSPVIDPDTQYMYCVVWTSPIGSSSQATHAMHVIDLKSGKRVCPPVSLQNLSYTPANGKTQVWKSIMRKQRSSLLFTNINNVKTVFFASGTISETGTGASGWICAFDVMTNQFVAQLTTSAGTGAGIWMGGSGLCADSKGNLYCMTGNGNFDGVNDFAESILKIQYNPRYEYIPPQGGGVGSAYHDNGAANISLKIIDWWTPYTDRQRTGNAKLSPDKLAGVSAPSEAVRPVNHMDMPKFSHKKGDLWMMATNNGAWADEDLGSGGLTIFEDLDIVLACGKDGIAYLVRMSNMGKTMPADLATPAGKAANYAKLVQEPQWFTYFPGYGVSAMPADATQLNFMFQGKTRHMHSTPVSFNMGNGSYNVFCWGENSPLRAWKLTKAGLQFLAQGQEIASANVTNSPGGMAGGFMCGSCNDKNAGTRLLWASIPLGDANRSVTGGRFIVYNADQFPEGPNGQGIAKLWDSAQWNINYTHNKFNVPVVSGGKIFMPTYSGQVDVYGLS